MARRARNGFRGPVTRPPSDPSAYVRSSELHAARRRQYFEETRQIASSRTTPWCVEPYPAGTWKIDDMVAGAYGHEISELVELDPGELEPGEFYWPTMKQDLRSSGKLDDAERYADWIAEHGGRETPPIEVVQTERGTLRVVDGHRRLAAAAMAEVPVRAWINWLAPHPKGSTTTPYVGMTYEIATGRKYPTEHALSDLEPEARHLNPTLVGSTRADASARRIGNV